MNSDSEIAAYGLVVEELERFGRVLDGSEREEAADLEELLQLEYSDNDAVLYALGEEDQTWTDLSTRSWPMSARTGQESL